MLLFSSGKLETFKKKSILKISTKPLTISLFQNDVALTIFNKTDHHHIQKVSHSACGLNLAYTVSLFLPSFKPTSFLFLDLAVNHNVNPCQEKMMFSLLKTSRHSSDNFFHMSLLQKQIHLKSCHHEAPNTPISPPLFHSCIEISRQGFN